MAQHSYPEANIPAPFWQKKQLKEAREARRKGRAVMGLRGEITPEDLTELFPYKWVRCETCGAYYDSREVYFITHREPYEFRCPCGPQGLYLRWRQKKSSGTEPLPPQTARPGRECS